jgi:hypothetical protein
MFFGNTMQPAFKLDERAQKPALALTKECCARARTLFSKILALTLASTSKTRVDF